MNDGTHDAVVIGAGVNELVAAHYLARAGVRVLVLEGTGTSPDPDAETGTIPPRIVRDLQLQRHGLQVRSAKPWAAAALPAGGRLELWHDMARSVEAIRRVSPRDAERWPRFCGRMAQLACLLAALYVAPPPDPLGRSAGELAHLAGLGLRMRRLGRQGIEELLRIATMPVADLLDDWFECDALKGVLATAGVRHLQQGPRSGGTAFALLHHHVGSPPGVFRPPRANLTEVLARIPGIEIRRGADVSRIAIEGPIDGAIGGGRATGVALASGEQIAAGAVVSGFDPRRTLLELGDPGWLDPEFVRGLRHLRARGVTARVTLTLERAPGFPALVIAPSLDYIERAHDDAKYGRVSGSPWLEASAAGEDAAGRPRVEVRFQYAPYRLADGEWDAPRRAALERLALDVLAQHEPELAAAVVGASTATPRDLETAYGHPEGQPYQVELALDQALWMRPLPGWARYRTPIDGLYLCGAATHPGGGVPGACGYNAAREVVRDLRRN